MCVINYKVLVLWLVLLGMIPAYAVDLSSELSSTGVPITQKFQFQDTVFIDYSNGGKLKDMLQSKNITVSFDADSTDVNVLNLMNMLDTNLVREQHSLVKINNLQLQYTATFQSDSKTATIDYKIILEPTILNYVMAKNSDSQTVIDASWIGLSSNLPVLVPTQYGMMDINHASGFLQLITPDAYDIMNSTDAIKILNKPLIDSRSLVQQPSDSWQHLFDPAYIIHETSSWGYNGTKVPITTFTIGQSSIGNQLKDVTSKVDLALDQDYQIQTIQHASSATVQVDGHAKIQGDATNLVFVTTPSDSGTGQQPSSNLSVQVIYAMAGMGGIVAAAILYWSNKKMKSVQKKDETGSGPIQYEERRHWADRFEK